MGRKKQVAVALLLFAMQTALCCRGVDLGDFREPKAPSDLTAEGRGSSIFLSWKDNSDNEDGFRIAYRCELYREGFTAGFERLAEVGKNVTSYEHKAGFDRRCEYKVRAYNMTRRSSFSNTAIGTTAPSAPEGLTAEPGFDTGLWKEVIVLKWTSTSHYEEKAEVERRKAGDEEWEKLATLESFLCNYKDTTVEPGETYEYRVRELNSAGASNYSNTDSATAETDWIFEILDISASGKPYPSMAIDSDDAIHISYYDNGFPKYITNRSGEWNVEAIPVLDTPSGLYTSLALDAHGGVHVVYYDPIGFALDYATKLSGEWNVVRIHDQQTSLWSVSLAVSEDGDAHIVFSDGLPVYMTNRSGSWEKEALGSCCAEWISIALDSDGWAHIATVHSSTGGYEVYYIKQVPVGWTFGWQKYLVDTIDDSEDPYVDIAIDHLGSAHLVWTDFMYYDFGWEYVDLLNYAVNTSGEWEIFTIDEAENSYPFLYPAVAIDSNNDVHIVYQDQTKYGLTDLKYATNISGEWRTSLIDAASRPRWPSIVVDSLGFPHVSYLVTGPEGAPCLIHATTRPY